MVKLKCPDCDMKILKEIDEYFECPSCEQLIPKCDHCGGAPEVENTNCCFYCKMD